MSFPYISTGKGGNVSQFSQVLVSDHKITEVHQLERASVATLVKHPASGWISELLSLLLLLLILVYTGYENLSLRNCTVLKHRCQL